MTSLSRKTILVVEDEEELRTFYVTALKSAGFEVQEAADGTDALELLDISTPDVVVLDLWLPMLDGYSVLDEVAANSHMRDIPIVVVTGAEINVERISARAVLHKPIDPLDLIAAVRACL